MKAELKTALRMLPIIICLLCTLVYVFRGRDISIQTIIDYTPDNGIGTVLFLLLVYALKSMTVVFPIVIPMIAGGFLFSPGFAIFVNSLGIIIELIIPYWAGRISGGEIGDQLCEKYPKLDEFVMYQQGRSFFMAFFLRITGVLPVDAVSMYMGAIKLPFGIYMLGSFVGVFPGLISTTLIGTNITDPTSPMFWAAVIITAGIALGSTGGYFIWRKLRVK